jgi:3-oxoacyl-[acyl-carrier protein] reductase
MGEPNMSDLKGKAALVTGGSRGIGAAAAIRLAEQGADVAITFARSEAQAQAVVAQIEATGRRGLAIHADNADAAAVEAAVRRAADAFGRLDILVNNGGIYRAAPIDALTLADFDETMAVNLRSVFVASKAAAALMGDGGRIILVGSNLAEYAAYPGQSIYSASKAALIGFTKGLARDLGPRGITANVIHPGAIDTDMNPADGDHAGLQLSHMAIPHFGDPSDTASLIAWLASPQARFVTGAGVTIDGGANA